MRNPRSSYTIRNLTFYYPEQEKETLQDVSFALEPGQFVTLVGPSGCGKSTLLRQLKTVLAPHGVKTGEILFEGRPLDSIDQREQSARIGFVQQSPENQIVTDKVWHELAFGLESLGYDTPTIRGRVAEMASFFGIQTWFYKKVTELSGGQKQLLNLASIMAMQPSVLILDEPTSQLDPIAAADFLATVGKINRELGTTVIMTEHRLEEVFPMSDRVLVMDEGRLIADGPPRQVGHQLKDTGHTMFLAMPTAMRVWAAVPNHRACPITVRDGRDWLADFAASHSLITGAWPETASLAGEVAISLEDIWFKYEKDLPDVVKGLSLTVRKGEFFAVLGGNGTGKTTTLSIIGGLRRAYRGEVTVSGSLGILPQSPQALFVKKTVREDLYEIFKGKRLSNQEKDDKVARAVKLCRLEQLLDRHPYDLSGGEQQRAALAKVLLLDPEILLLDEPTKGLDAEFKQVFAVILKTLQRGGVTIFMVSHDVEFCAEYTQRCALFFDGRIVTEGTPRAFFSGNSFYTTSANRMARGLLPEAITADHVIGACGGQVPPVPELDEDAPPLPKPGSEARDGKPAKLPLWRKVIAAVSGLIALVTFIKSIGVTDLAALLTPSGMSGLAGDYTLIYAVLIAALFVLALSVSRKSPPSIHPVQVPREKRKLGKRTLAAAIMILLLIPLTIFVGVYYLGARKYYFIALLILLETMLPFAMVFEGRKPQARELVVIAVLCTLGVAGRAAFFMLPEFKPVVALVIISGVALGGEAGFLVGAMTMLVSNVMFSQGPWTPWQMFAMGIIGFLAGVLFRKGWLRRSRASLCVFGALASVLIYGGIMNPAAALMWTHTLDWKILLTYYITGFPVDLVRAAATVFFLWFAAEPMLEKLDRIKVKYGLVE
ncbi:Vitamin B12 import ATP-binding protein BtuD [bioreactor metagenome]|uniref:Vitamin B12 import ATP-binding protein BtuD n=1 Tax=bioreactor metagenome TaxID=1076179 RepID=A0A644U8J9_9ZZZZ|nr:ATP-binding cassette domain-containing protein [Desulfitobacterium hafniense]MEA5023422.1 ATP-binding cassette domain-containing protein [Desulfitobacterium hafniense]